VLWALVAPDRTGSCRHDEAFDVTKGLMRDTLQSRRYFERVALLAGVSCLSVLPWVRVAETEKNA
jgi:hypothetical protein